MKTKTERVAGLIGFALLVAIVLVRIVSAEPPSRR